MPGLLVQTLITHQGKVLLGRWRSGSLAGRVTGLLGQASVPDVQHRFQPEIAAIGVCRDLLGADVVANVDPRRLRRRGLFSFKENDVSTGVAAELGETYVEHQLVLKLTSEEAQGLNLAPSESFEPIGWFERGSVPFKEMPEDDEVWYDSVVFDDKTIRGSFVFNGTKLLEHQLEDVDPCSGLCDPIGTIGSSPEVPVLLHNPACSKSRGLKEALESKSVEFSERNYLQDPLSISELEVLKARLEASGLQDAAAAMCRRTEEVERLKGTADAEAAILEFLVATPSELQRPALLVGQQAALGRPSAKDALRLLD
mmetsp:Transcript_3842/g.8694  ORF Transcript_3842/g.8694 Transcript_3842/m.8694 type:complete len:313 (+) Transcript_3842:127-1065(+)